MTLRSPLRRFPLWSGSTWITRGLIRTPRVPASASASQGMLDDAETWWEGWLPRLVPAGSVFGGVLGVADSWAWALLAGGLTLTVLHLWWRRSGQHRLAPLPEKPEEVVPDPTTRFSWAEARDFVAGQLPKYWPIPGVRWVREKGDAEER